MTTDERSKGFSAGQMRTMSNRRREPTTISAPIRYDIKKNDQIVAQNLSLKEVQKMFPKIKGNTIRKRLLAGEREIDRLGRPPAPPGRARFSRRNKP